MSEDAAICHNKLTITLVIDLSRIQLEMWANAQRDGRPAEYN